MKNPIIEAVKEGLRVVIFAVISYLLTGTVVTDILALIFGVHLDPTLRIIITGAITSILRAIDKWGHENDNKLQLPF